MIIDCVNLLFVLHVKVLLIGIHELCIAGTNHLAVVDLLLRVSVQKIIVDLNFVSLEERNGREELLHSNDSQIQIKALYLLISLQKNYDIFTRL